MALRSSIRVPALLMIILLVESCNCSSLPQDQNLIDQTCKNTPFPDLCVSSLRSDPRSSAADLEGLAGIMVDVIKAKATSTLNRIKELISGNPTPALNSCNDQYSVIITADVPQATKAVQTGNYKFAVDAAEDAATEAEYCESGFGGSSPLSAENREMNGVSLVTSAIVKMLL